MDFLHLIGQINVLIEHSASQWWVIPLVSLFCLIDGFFLFLPSETAIVALASIAAKSGEPNIWFLIMGASAGAIIGDNIAYFLGRKLGTTRFNWMRRPRGAKAFAWAGKELEKRGAMLIFTARYIPVGRIAVNFTAGATYFPWRRFVVLDAVAVVTWAGYSVAVGTFAGRWVHDNPLLGVGIAVAFAIVIGFAVDHAMKYLHHVLEKRGKLAPRPEPGLAAATAAARVRAQALAEEEAKFAAAVAAGSLVGPLAGPAGDDFTEATVPTVTSQAAAAVVPAKMATTPTAHETQRTGAGGV
ncbi:membrane protein DedA, SNARE-associated domain [Arthrobacter alpinus]|uniref:Membrane protein DedA, SNARE-associated domain n=1 Tax=Arthrobacter alpinus TaxID=656366 RepID=A0A1H5KS11_9MICC|nr:DedA family protein [Arthrobacter alpinus]SEE67592.1 membrane protein DedA, SNARE-associated domain [Arthrobacter alpinus]